MINGFIVYLGTDTLKFNLCKLPDFILSNVPIFALNILEYVNVDDLVGIKSKLCIYLLNKYSPVNVSSFSIKFAL